MATIFFMLFFCVSVMMWKIFFQRFVAERQSFVDQQNQSTIVEVGQSIDEPKWDDAPPFRVFNFLFLAIFVVVMSHNL